MSLFDSPDSMLKSVHKSWHEVLKTEFGKTYFEKLLLFLRSDKKSNIIYPPEEMIFSWTNLTPFKDVRVVILGQDPYHGKGQAHGLAFSVLEPCKPPGSLINIYKELETDIPGFKRPEHGNLSGWAKQGVLMINAVLTVRQSAPNSHKDKGWETFTDAVMQMLNKKEHLVFILWGKYAQKKCAYISRNKHCVIQSAHPSPLSVKNFLGSKCFSRTNTYLISKDLEPIDWSDL